MLSQLQLELLSCLPSGVKIRNVLISKSFRPRLTVVGATGRNGDRARDHVAPVCQCRRENAIIRRLCTAVHSASVNALVIKLAISIHAPKANQASELNSAQRRTRGKLKVEPTPGSHSSILTIHVNFTALTRTTR